MKTGEKCEACKGSGMLDYGPNINLDPSGESIVCQCDYCNGTGIFDGRDFTCYRCKDVDICPGAWNLYNTNGDCLASK
jgi:DnaJ-class molecular chaperone